MSDTTDAPAHPPHVPTLPILAGLVLGGVAGVLVNSFLSPAWGKVLADAAEPIGQVFLRLLFLTVVPLVFTSLAVGVAKLGDLGRLGRIGAITLSYFVLTTACAVIIGLSLVQLVRPGIGLSEETREQLRDQYAGEMSEKSKPVPFGVQTFLNIIPRNPVKAATDGDMLAVIFVAILTGVALTSIHATRAKLLMDVLEGIADVTIWIIRLAMRLAPIGVFCLIFATATRFGFGVLLQLGWYVGTVIVGLSVQVLVVYPLLLVLIAGWNPVLFFRKSIGVIVTAFSTSSSSATLPTTIRTAVDELDVPAPLAGFVLPLGATLNMNGTALFEGVTVLFLAQVFGVPLSLGDQAIVVALSVITAIGAAGVPGGSIPLLAMVLTSVRVPPEGIALILGVDRILDMCRTTVNVLGDLTASVAVARFEATPPNSAERPMPEAPQPTP